MRGWIAAVLAVASAGCSDRLSGAEGDPATESESESSSTTGESESESESETDTSEPDLPPDPPEDCSSGAQILPYCSTDDSGYTCYDTPKPDIAIPMCSELSWGPRELELGPGLAACGCESTRYLSLRDLDGDGADELLATCSIPDAVLVWRGRADGLLSCATVHPTTAPDALWLIDFDEDGLEDLIAIHGLAFGEVGMSLLPATEPGVFGDPQPLDALLEPTPTVYINTLELDVDGDARAELLASVIDGNYDYSPVYVWSAQAGQLSLDLEPFGQLAGGELHRADLDGDGRLDLVVAADQSWWARGSAAGLGTPEPFDGGADHSTIALGDVDGDEMADLVLGGRPPGYRLGSGDGSFGALMSGYDSPWPNQSFGQATLVHDLDGDGRGEIIIHAYDEGWSVWRSSDLGPRFDMQVDLELTHSYAAGDVDADGRGDLFTATWLSSPTNSQITRWRAGG